MKQFEQFDIEDLKSFDLKEYLFKVISYWKLFLLMLVLGLFITTYINKRSVRIYSLNSIITAKEESNPLFTSNTSIAFNWGGASDKVETIKAVLKSRTHNEKVVDKLKFYIEYLQQGRFRMEDVYGKTLFQIVTDSSDFQLLNVPIQLNFLDNNEVLLVVEFEEEKASLTNYGTNATKDFQIENATFSKKFNLNDLIDTPFAKFKIKKDRITADLTGETYYIKFNSFNSTVRKFQNISVEALTKGTSLLDLNFKGTNKKKIVDFINTTVEVLDIDQREQKIQYATKTKAYIDTVFNLASINLKNIEKELGDFKQKNDVYDLSIEGQTLFAGVTKLDNQQQQISDRLEYYTNLENYILSNREVGEDIPVPVNVGIEDENITKNIGELIEFSKQKKSLEQTVNSNYPPLTKVIDNINITREVVLENIANLKKATAISLNNVKKRLATFNSRLNTLPKKEQGLIEFERDYNLTATNYEYLKQKQYEAGTAIAANVSDIKILDKAKDVGQGPITPNAPFNYLLALILSLGLPFLYIVLKELFSNKILTVEEIEKKYEIPVLGVVGTGNFDNYLAVFNKPKSSLSESFRALRSNIQFLFKKAGNSKLIVITSSVSGEGKTLCSINMASVFAMSDKRTILLGLDLRKPKLHDDFDVSNEFGVVNYLIGQKELEEVIQTTNIPNLDIITSGPVPPNPSELLLSDQTAAMMDYLKANYDYIIIDTPPIGLVADAIELFKYSDAVMYIIRQNYTQRGMPKMIDDKYKNGEVKNISYVLNDFSMKDSYGYGYGYGYGGNGYGKYGNGYHQNEKKSWLKKIFNK